VLPSSFRNQKAAAAAASMTITMIAIIQALRREGLEFSGKGVFLLLIGGSELPGIVLVGFGENCWSCTATLLT
jgi:hypothetical protein